MNKLATLLFPLAVSSLMSICPASWAESRMFEGNIESARGVVHIPITLDNALEHVFIWTDSYAAGAHFDPITALWRDGALVAYNDDRPGVMPGQTSYDSGLYFDSLPGGSFVLTITNYANVPVSRNLADGFRYDAPGADVLPLNNCPTADNCPGSYWRLHLQDNVAPPAVPEPSAWLLYAGGLGLLAGRRHFRRRSLRDSGPV